MREDFRSTPAERRKEAQRQKIIEAADALYKANGGDNGGFEATTVEAIAEKSDISLRTFFRYFESKADVIYIDVQYSTKVLEQSIANRLKSEPVTAAIFNSRLDQLRLFAANKLNRERLVRALNAAQFQDRLVVLRHQSKEAIIRGILPHLGGPEVEKYRQARTLATIFNDFFADALDFWGKNQDFDVAGYVMDCVDLLPSVVKQIHAEIEVPGRT